MAFEFPTLISFVTRIKTQFLHDGLKETVRPSISIWDMFAAVSTEGLGAEEDAMVKEGRVERFKRVSFGVVGVVFFVAFAATHIEVPEEDDEWEGVE